jgi:hypothetical protein
MTSTNFVYVTFIRTTPERLWSALTSPDFTKQYWFGMHHETDWKAGSPWRLNFPDGRVADAAAEEAGVAPSVAALLEGPSLPPVPSSSLLQPTTICPTRSRHFGVRSKPAPRPFRQKANSSLSTAGISFNSIAPKPWLTRCCPWRPRLEQMQRPARKLISLETLQGVCPSYAFFNSAMSSLIIFNIASATRLARARSKSFIISPSTAGTICQ